MITNSLDKVLVSDWRNAWKFLSLWFFFILGMSPDLFQLAVDFGLLKGEDVPAAFAKLVNYVAFIGAATRLIDQAAIAKGLKLSKPAE